MKKPKRLAALCAAFFMAVCLCSTAVHAEEAPTGSASSDLAGTVLPTGTGTVKEVYTDEDGRRFYTIQTPAGNTFYLIIDFTQQTENVYFLDAVAEKDLLALAEKAGNAVLIDTESSIPGTSTKADPASQPSGKAPVEQPESSGPFSMILIGAVVVIGGGAALYFKIIRKKRSGHNTHEEYEEEYVPDEPEAGSYDENTEPDLPPWEDDDV